MAFESIHRPVKVRAELESSGVDYSRIHDPDNLLEQYGLPKGVVNHGWIGALMSLLEHSWFESVWIVQEVVVSSLVAVVQGEFETT